MLLVTPETYKKINSKYADGVDAGGNIFSLLDSRIKNILNNQRLSDMDKWLAYRQELLRYGVFKRQERTQNNNTPMPQDDDDEISAYSRYLKKVRDDDLNSYVTSNTTADSSVSFPDVKPARAYKFDSLPIDAALSKNDLTYDESLRSEILLNPEERQLENLDYSVHDPDTGLNRLPIASTPERGTAKKRASSQLPDSEIEPKIPKLLLENTIAMETDEQQPVSNKSLNTRIQILKERRDIHDKSKIVPPLPALIGDAKHGFVTTKPRDAKKNVIYSEKVLQQQKGKGYFSKWKNFV